MKHIVLCRIDDRFTHRQVVTAWVKQIEGNRIVIIDEALVRDVFLQKIIKAAASSDIRIDMCNIENGVCELKKKAEDRERTIILVETPQVVEALIDEGILLDKVILEGTGAKSGRRKFNHNVLASEEEIECMQRVMNKHIPMYHQLVSNEPPNDVGKMISGQERRSIMSILQAVLLGIIHYLGNSSIIAGPVSYYPVCRPLISGCLAGMLLGDPVQGTMIGATINLMYVGFMSAGDALSGDMCLAGILGAALGATGGLDMEVALAIAVSVGLIGTLLWFGRLTLDSVFAHMVDHLAEKGEAGKVWIPSVSLPQLIPFVLTLVPCMLACYFGVSYIQGIIDALGGTILNILMTIGGMMPALDIGLTLMYIFKGEAKVFFLIEFLVSAYLGSSMIAIGFISLCIAIIYTQKRESTGGNVARVKL